MPVVRPPSRYAEWFGMRIEVIEPGRARASMPIAPTFHQSQGAVHGGALFSLADTAVGTAVRSLVGSEAATATVEAKINYLARSSSGELVAESRVVHRGKTLVVGECDVFNTPAPTDRCPAPARVLVARFSATFIARPKRSADLG
jgi:acyl-CoA thioesterase